MWRALAVGAFVAAGFHMLSIPLAARFTARLMGAFDPAVELEATPVEVVVLEEEVIQQALPPEEELLDSPPDEPVAAAEQSSAPPLATTAEPMPTGTQSADTVQTAAAIATENGAIGGQGAVGDSTVIGLVPGSGTPTEGNFEINLPSVSSPPNPARQPVQQARQRTTSRSVTCAPCSLPDYPLTERREQIEGQPVISVIFDGSGRVVQAEVEVSSGNAAFDRAALAEAQENWRFRDSQGIGGQVSVDVTFVMEGSDQYAEAQQAGEIRSVELPPQQTSSSRPAVSASQGPTETAAAADSSASLDAVELSSQISPSNELPIEPSAPTPLTVDSSPPEFDPGVPVMAPASEPATDSTAALAESFPKISENNEPPVASGEPVPASTPVVRTPVPEAPMLEPEGFSE
ncbi:MAG: energy transducer TonB [Cyanobacteria bacterium P01_B01_bin.77]